MCNADLHKKQSILPGKLYEEKNTVFACFKTYVNYPYRSILYSYDIISYIVQTLDFLNLIFQKIKTDAHVVINLFFKKYIYLSISPTYFYQSDQFYQNSCTAFMLSYFMEFFLVHILYLLLLVYVCSFAVVLLLFLVVLLSFSYWTKVLSIAIKIQPLQQALLN